MRRFAHLFFEQLCSLHLPGNDFAVAGSGPLYIRGLISELNDLDVVARGRAWQIATMHGNPEAAPYCSVRVVSLFNKNVEIFDGWFPKSWSIDYLVDQADVIEGVRFIPLDVVRQTKEKLHRPKDIEHIRIIDEYVNRRTS